jgi:hypothetical protein
LTFFLVLFLRGRPGHEFLETLGRDVSVVGDVEVDEVGAVATDAGHYLRKFPIKFPLLSAALCSLSKNSAIK